MSQAFLSSHSEQLAVRQGPALSAPCMNHVGRLHCAHIETDGSVGTLFLLLVRPTTGFSKFNIIYSKTDRHALQYTKERATSGIGFGDRPPIVIKTPGAKTHTTHIATFPP